MWLTDVSIRRPVFITMVVLALIVMGLQARNQMPNELQPDIDFPFVTILTIYPGAGPQEIETLVSEPLEDAVGSTGGLRNITSTSQDGISVIGMEFELGTDLDAAAADVRAKVKAAQNRLPDDIEEPSIEKVDISTVPIMTLAVEGNMSGKEKRILADNEIKDALSKIKGVASVTVTGGDVREVSVAVDKDRLRAYGLSINDVAQALRAENLNLPSGSVKEGSDGLAERDYSVRTVGEFTSAEEISNVRIALRNQAGGTVRLGDIATVTDTVQEPTTITRLNQQPGVILAIQKQSDANTVEVAEGIKEEMAILNGHTTKDGKVVEGTLPQGVKLITITDESIFVEDALSDVARSLIEGIILVVLIVFLFLHSGRATLIVALAIPTSLFATYLPMWIFGFSMNMMTMLALALVVGILVDDSIVVLENIERHLRLGEEPKVAALNGRSEIGLAAVTITLVDVVVFVPIAFMGGIVGQFFRQFGITVATATLFSLFMSFTLTPMLASRLLKHKKQESGEASNNGFRDMPAEEPGFWARVFAKFEAFYTAQDRRYRGLLAWALQNRGLTFWMGALTLLGVIGMVEMVPMNARIFIAALIGMVLFLATLRTKSRIVALGYAALMIPLVLFVRFPLGVEMLPATDTGDFSVVIELPAGSGMDATDRVVRRVEDILEDVEGMEYYYSTIGSTSAGGIFGGGSQGSQYARITAKLVDRTEREKSVEDIVSELTEKTALVPGGEIRVSAGSSMGPGNQEVTMEVTGPNMQELVFASEQVEEKIRSVEGVSDVQNSWNVGQPELRVTVDRLRSAEYGISVAQVAQALRTSIEGNTDSKLRDAGNEYDIRVRLDRLDRNNTADVAGIIVGHNNGLPVYLRDVANVDLTSAPNQIDRKNRQRLITVSATIARGYNLGNVQGEINQALQSVQTGSARVSAGGIGEIMVESFRYMFSALFLAILLVYMLMGALFESFATPLVIMISLPQAMIGALLALMLTGSTFSIVSMIGIIMLMGLVAKNAILFVDYTNTLRGRGLARNEAVLEAGPTRLRPILMTTMAMVGGMLPTALAVSRGSEQRAPMAIAVIGGLIMSTMLTLLVIPSVYTYMDDITAWIKKSLLGLFHHPVEPQESEQPEETFTEVTDRNW